MSKAPSPDHVVEELLAAAQHALHRGDISEALTLYQSALSIEPGHGMANYWLGVLALKSESYQAAVGCLEVAASKHPDLPDFQLDLGLAYRALNQNAKADRCLEAARRAAPTYGPAQLNFAASFERENRLQEAIEACKRGLTLFPNDIELLRKLASLHSRIGNWQDSLSTWKRILELKSSCASSHFAFGEICFRMGNFDLAHAAFERTLELDQSMLNARLNLGITLQRMGNTESALTCFLEASALHPGNSDIHKGLGDLYRELERWPEAIASWQTAVDLRPNYADAWQNLGLGLECQHRLQEALACHQRVVQLLPNNPNALRYLGMVCQDLGRLEEARECYGKALQIAPKDPEIHWQIFALQASLGEFPQAWEEHEWRWHIKTRTTPKREFPQPAWDGSPLQGRTLLLHAEQGFGDTIQAARYVPLAQERGGKVLLWCPPNLVTLLQTLSGTTSVFSQMRQDTHFDTHLPMMSLPHVFKTTVETIPNQVPYLRAPANAMVSFPQLTGRNPKIGLNWCGSLSQPNDQRPVPFEFLEAIVHITGTDFFSLQIGPRNLSAQKAIWTERIFDLSEQLTDFGQTAAAIENLDLIITVDTAIAHLAGALGKPVWVLLPFSPDWRWMRERDDCPWYPTMRLFRQTSPGDWGTVLERLSPALTSWNAQWHWSATLNSWLGKGLAHHQSGHLDQAEEFYRLVLERDPKHCDASRFLGVLFRQRGDLEAARIWMEKALQLGPTSAQVHHDLGLIRFELGRIEEAIRCYRQAIEIQPDFPEAHYHLGNAYYAAKRTGDAVQAYARAVTQQPSMADAYYNLGLLAHEEGKIDLAISHYEAVLRLEPAHSNALLNLGSALKDANRLEEAERSLRRLLHQDAAHHRARVSLASILTSRGDLESALALCLDVISSKPSLTEAWLNLGVIRQAMGDIPAAIEAFERTLELKPDFEDARYNLGIARLLSGDFELGWKDYEARWLSSVPVFERSPFQMPLWKGEDLQGRSLLIHAEQGHGDTIQFVRYAALAARKGARIVLECPKSLVRLLKTVPGVTEVISAGEPLPDCDFHLPLMSFPFRFQTSLETIPNHIPYLSVPNGIELAIPSSPNSSIKVGLVWSGNPSHGADRARSISCTDLWPLWKIPAVAFYSLQVGVSNESIERAKKRMPIIDLAPQLTDFAHTAAAIQGLDLVISVDTAVAHLSGALGKPVWILLPFAPDWRWLTDRTESPWYPHARLFRQRKRGDWSTVIQEASEALQNLGAAQ